MVPKIFRKPPAILLLAIMLVTLFNAAWISNAQQEQGVHPSGLPKLDEIWFKAYPGAAPDVIVEEFLAGVTDWIDGPYRKDLLDMVIAAGHKVYYNCLRHNMPDTYIFINYNDYDGNGDVNWPLNESSFRVALSYIYGLDQKQEDIYSYIQGPWIIAAGNILTPACPYYNESVRVPDTDRDTAWRILQSAGYYVEDGYLKKDGKTVRNMEVWYTVGSLFWERGPGAGFVRAFNNFMYYIGATNGPTMTLVPKSLSVIIEALLFRNFDFICLGLQFDVYYCPQMIYDWFYGIDEELDEYLEAWVSAPPYSPQAYEAGFNVQYRIIYELMPIFPISYGNSICTVARDRRGELMNVIPIPGTCYFNRWSYMTIHWKGPPGSAWPGGTAKIALDGKWSTLNPFAENTTYGWRILNTVISPLLIEDPNHGGLKRPPWIATNMTIEPWVSIPELGIVNGMKVTFLLRQDVYWHDLKPVTSKDCVNNLKLLRKYRPPKWSYVWGNLVCEESRGPYKFIAYSSTVDYVWPYYVAEAALLIPKHVADAIERMGGNPIAWDFTKPYEELGIGPPPPQYPFLKQLVGCGPYILHYADPNNLTAHVVKFNEFFINAPVVGSVIGEWWYPPPPQIQPYTFEVLVQNMAAKSNDENGELVNATFYAKVYFDDNLIGLTDIVLLTPFSSIEFGLYTIEPSAGCHKIKVEVYDGETGTLWHKYVHKFVVVVREDVTTFSGDYIDCKVDIRDIFRAALAYGSRPCTIKWDPACDINDDFKIDIRDIFAIALKFGWSAPC